jgi:glyoxylase-like metal-dependent hydrolase (beta-lactamase superfamily II)
MTQDQLAATLFHSLRDKIMTLPDDVTVYPAHGAGSACGKNMSKRRFQPLVTKRPLCSKRYDRGRIH